MAPKLKEGGSFTSWMDSNSKLKEAEDPAGRKMKKKKERENKSDGGVRKLNSGHDENFDVVAALKAKEMLQPVMSHMMALEKRDPTESHGEQKSKFRRNLVVVGRHICALLSSMSKEEAAKWQSRLWVCVSVFTEYDEEELFGKFSRAVKERSVKEKKEKDPRRHHHHKEKNMKGVGSREKLGLIKEDRGEEQRSSEEKEKGKTKKVCKEYDEQHKHDEKFLKRPGEQDLKARKEENSSGDRKRKHDGGESETNANDVGEAQHKHGVTKKCFPRSDS